MRPTTSLVPILALIICATVSSLAHEGAAPESRSANRLDYKHYLDHFKKSYSSHAETATRQLYFYASAFQVYVAGLAYKSGASSHYLALNPMSDLSPREWELMQNEHLAGGVTIEDETSDSISHATPHGADPGNLVEGFQAESEKRLGGAHSSSSSIKSRRKRSTSPKEHRQRRRPRRRMSIDMLIQPAEPLVEPVHVLAKLDRRPKRNNPQYNALLMETMSRGLIDQQEELRFWRLIGQKPPEARPKEGEGGGGGGGGAKATPVARILNRLTGFTRNVGKLLAELDGDGDLDRRDEKQNAKEHEDEDDEFDDSLEELPDEMFVDWRDSGCMFQPRQQGLCGSCYAFAATTIAEWLYCRAHNKLVAFSEQYIIDCGKSHVHNILGCGGGGLTSSAKFIHNFGLELAEHYPYIMREGQCPYDRQTDLNEVGYIRMNLSHVFMVPIDRWDEFLMHAPFVVNVATPPDFKQYGGGVDNGEKCRDHPTHAMVVVGHGREDGEEYWLIRNSHGTQWGVGGFWKLSRLAPDRCIHDQEGYAFGTKNGKNFEHTTNMNDRNKRARQAKGRALELKPTDLV